MQQERPSIKTTNAADNNNKIGNTRTTQYGRITFHFQATHFSNLCHTTFKILQSKFMKCFGWQFLIAVVVVVVPLHYTTVIADICVSYWFLRAPFKATPIQSHGTRCVGVVMLVNYSQFTLREKSNKFDWQSQVSPLNKFSKLLRVSYSIIIRLLGGLKFMPTICPHRS